MRRSTMMPLVGVLLVIASIVLLVVMYVSTRNYSETTAKVISVEYDPAAVPDEDGTVTNDYDVTFEYEVDGKTYTATYDCNKSDYSVGDEIKLRYDPNKPEHTSLGKMSLPVLIGLSAAAMLIGLIIIIKGRRS